MKKIFLLALGIILFSSIRSQQNGSNLVHGFVIDSISRLPLEYATVTIFFKDSKKPLTGTVTNLDGSFTIKDLQTGNYTIVVEFIGYNSFSLTNLQLNKNKPVNNLGYISLIQHKTSLQTVTVIAQPKLIENKIDKIIFNAEKDVTAQSGVATDVLKKIPQVSVDVDGNVQLAGSSGVRFLINGKPSTAFGSNVADVLQSIPASQIKSVEVITNPGAKYDAQGLGGIINIILKTSKAKGYNGSLSLTAGTRQENGSFNFNVRNNNFGFNAFISGNKRLNAKTPSTSDRFTTDSNTVNYLGQSGTGIFERHGFQAGAGFDYTFKKLNSLSGSLSYNNFGNSGNRTVNQDLQINKGSTIPPVLSLINTNNQFNEKNVDASVNYKRTFAQDGQELEMALNTSTGNENNASANDQFLLPQDSLFYGSRSSNPGKTTETEVSIDYTQPLKKDVLLGVGGKASFYNISSTSEIYSFQLLQQHYQLDTSLANDLSYKQKVYAAYSELSFPLFKIFDAKIGGRYERTEISSYYANARLQVKIPGYNTFVPSIYFSKKITDEQSIRIGYSKRIERPDYGDLNPFVNTNDPKNLSAGNSHLQPEITHKFEIMYNKDLGRKGSLMVSLFYRINDNDIQPYINYYSSYKVGDSVYTNVAITTKQNIGREKNLVLNVYGDLHLASKLNIRGNVALFRRTTINEIDAGYNYSSFNYKLNLNANYQFSNTLLAEFFGSFNSARNEAQGKYPTFTTYSLAIRKQFWKKQGSLALNANNFLSEKLTQKTVLSGPGFSTSSIRKIPFRSIGINFAWKFGKLEFKKTKPEADSNSNGQSE